MHSKLAGWAFSKVAVCSEAYLCQTTSYRKQIFSIGGGGRVPHRTSRGTLMARKNTLPPRRLCATGTTWSRAALTALAVAVIASSLLLVGTSAPSQSWSTPPSGVRVMSQTSDIGVPPGATATPSAQARHGEPAHTTVMAEVSARSHSSYLRGGGQFWWLGLILIPLFVVYLFFRRRR